MSAVPRDLCSSLPSVSTSPARPRLHSPLRLHLAPSRQFPPPPRPPEPARRPEPPFACNLCPPPPRPPVRGDFRRLAQVAHLRRPPPLPRRPRKANNVAKKSVRPSPSDRTKVASLPLALRKKLPPSRPLCPRVLLALGLQRRTGRRRRPVVGHCPGRPVSAVALTARSGSAPARPHRPPAPAPTISLSPAAAATTCALALGLHLPLRRPRRPLASTARGCHLGFHRPPLISSPQKAKKASSEYPARRPGHAAGRRQGLPHRRSRLTYMVRLKALILSQSGYRLEHFHSKESSENVN